MPVPETRPATSSFVCNPSNQPSPSFFSADVSYFTGEVVSSALFPMQGAISDKSKRFSRK